MERLNRFLARAGVASRRASDRLIQAGLVQVNGRRVDDPGTKIAPEVDRVVYDGRRISPPAASTYVLLNKPAGYLVSVRDPHHDRTVYELLNGVEARVFPVGRLDLDTWGVLLLTDDGDLGYRLTHPRYGVEKIYRATVRGVPSAGAVGRLCRGVELDDGTTAPAGVRLVRATGGNGVLELRLHEGRKRQVKRMCEAVGHPVRRLERVGFAGLTVSGLEPGRWRFLNPAEVEGLKRLLDRSEGEHAEAGHRNCH